MLNIFHWVVRKFMWMLQFRSAYKTPLTQSPAHSFPEQSKALSQTQHRRQYGVIPFSSLIRLKLPRSETFEWSRPAISQCNAPHHSATTFLFDKVRNIWKRCAAFVYNTSESAASYPPGNSRKPRQLCTCLNCDFFDLRLGACVRTP